MKFAVSDAALLRWIIPFPDDRDIILARGQMTIKTISRDVQFAIFEPFDAKIGFIKAGVLHPRKRFNPIDAVCFAAPKCLRIA